MKNTATIAITGPVLILGGHGWMSSFLANQLSDYFLKRAVDCGYSDGSIEDIIHIVDVTLPRANLRHLHDRPNIRFHQCDISDYDMIRSVVSSVNPKFIWHACSVIDLRIRPTMQLEKVNVIGTENVVKALCALPVGNAPRFLIYTSTIDVACEGISGVHDATEMEGYASCSPSQYEITKIKAEKIVIAANSPTLKTCALRPGHIFGPFDPVLNIVIKSPISIGPRWSRMSHIYVGNAASAHLHAAVSLLEEHCNECSNIEVQLPVAGKAFYICDFNANFMDFYFGLVGRQPSLFRLPKFMLLLVVYVAEMIQVFIVSLLRVKNPFHPMTGISKGILHPCCFLTASPKLAQKSIHYGVAQFSAKHGLPAILSQSDAMSETMQWVACSVNSAASSS